MGQTEKEKNLGQRENGSRKAKTVHACERGFAMGPRKNRVKIHRLAKLCRESTGPRQGSPALSTSGKCRQAEVPGRVKYGVYGVPPSGGQRV